MSALSLALPSKGRLQEQCLAYFADCGLKVQQDGGQRGYAAQLSGAPDVTVRLMSASEIASALATGEVQLGVTGEDVLREAAPGLDGLDLVAPLGFGRADLVVAAPRYWLDVTSLQDLAEVCAAHRRTTGRRLRVATKYIRLAGAFFEANGIDDYRIVESAGATEGAPAAGAAEVIVDITTTGQTLAANGLAPVPGGLILRSQAHLVASHLSPWSAQAKAAAMRLLDILEARERARALRLVRVRFPAERAQEAQRRVGEFGAALHPAAEDDELGFYCDAARAMDAARALTPLASGPVGVFEPRFVFAEPRALASRLERFLAQHALSA